MQLETAPRLRSNLRFVRQVLDGRPSYVVKDPVKLQYFRFGEVEAWLMQRMDGSRTLPRIAEELRQRFGLDATAGSLEPFVRRLKEMGLALRTPAEQRILLMESLRKERRLKLQGHGNTLLRMRFSLGDPDQLFDRMVARMPFFWTRGFVAISVVMFLIYGFIIASRWDIFSAGVLALYDPSFYDLRTIVTLYGLAVVIIGIHELGHGLTCKRLGGEVHEIGAMLLYFMPAFFCNVNDAWTFERRSHRLWVTFAGGWIQLFIAACAAIVWFFTEPGTLVHHWAFLSLLIGGGLAVLVNYNPLIPLDGYYALMDYLDIPNLRPRAFAYLGALSRRHLLRLDVKVPPVTDRERRIFLAYGLLAVIYSTGILALLAFLGGRLLVRHLGGWGWAILGFGAVWFSRRGFGVLRRTARVWIADKLAGSAVRRAALAFGGGVVLLVALAFVAPWTVRMRASVLVEPAERVWIRAPEEGRVLHVAVHEGQRVGRGDTLAVLWSDRLEEMWARQSAAYLASEREVARRRVSGPTDALRTAELALGARRSEAAELARRRESLLLRSPVNGIVATPRPEEATGSRAAAGDSLLELWTAGAPRVLVLMAQRDAGEVREGSWVRMRFPTAPGRSWSARVTAVGSGARDGIVEVWAALPPEAEEAGVRAGMLGRAKVEVARTTIAGAIGRWARRTVRVDWLL